MRRVSFSGSSLRSWRLGASFPTKRVDSGKGVLGVTENKSMRMPPNAPSFVRDLQNAGWQTHLVGKTHWTPHDKVYDLRDNMELMKEIGFDAVEIHMGHGYLLSQFFF